MVAEELTEEVVAVLFVLVGLEIEFVGLGTAGHRNGFCFRLLLGSDGGHHQFTELELRLHAEQALTTGNQRAVQRQRNITELNQLQDVILLALEFQLHLVFKIEHGLCVVIEVEFDLVADFGKGVQLDILVKIELGDFPLLDRQRRVVVTVVQHTENQFHIAGRADIDGIAAEDALEDVAADMDLGYQSPAAPVAVGSIGSTTVAPVVIDGIP